MVKQSEINDLMGNSLTRGSTKPTNSILDGVGATADYAPHLEAISQPDKNKSDGTNIAFNYDDHNYHNKTRNNNSSITVTVTD